MALPATATVSAIDTPQHPALSDQQLVDFGKALDKVRNEIQANIGEKDLAYIKKMQRRSTTFEVVGRSLIHFSFEPIGFTAGVISLWLHKQLEATEIGHTALHGAFDKIEGAEKWHSKNYKWKTPIDEKSWHRGHNLAHHQFTNIAGKDPDIDFGTVRLTEHTAHQKMHNNQLLQALLVLFPNFAFLMNLHFTGVTEAFGAKGRDDLHFIEDRSLTSKRKALGRALRKFVPYYAKEYVLFPALAGPFFWKVALGNWMSEVMRDVYSAATIFCGHVGEDVASYPEGTRAHGRGQWYAMQIGSAHNFNVPLWVSQLCGALDLQIEHHLFPKFPTNRLREAAPQVKAICEEFGVEYKSDSWPKTLKMALQHISSLSKSEHKNSLGNLGDMIEAMA